MTLKYVLRILRFAKSEILRASASAFSIMPTSRGNVTFPQILRPAVRAISGGELPLRKRDVKRKMAIGDMLIHIDGCSQ